MAKHIPWKASDDAFIVKHYGKKAIDDIAFGLERHPSSIKRRAAILGVSHQSHWTKEDGKFVVDNVDRGLTYCAKALGKTEETIRQYMKRNKIRPSRARWDNWTEEEDAFLLANVDSMVFYHISDKLDRTIVACKRRYELLCTQSTDA
jgi:hypothetical protein